MSLPIKVGLVAVASLAIVLLFMFLAQRRREAHEIGPLKDSRDMRKKVPFFRQEVVKREIRSLFPNTSPSAIHELFEANLPFTGSAERLQLALLKLSNGDLNELRRLLERVWTPSGLGNAEPGRIIAMAEWPEAQAMGFEYAKLLPEEQEQIFRRDLRQYLRWVK